jgi:serine/threonine protein kinase/tetratricopeptide (TPR) repeat protein
MTEAVATIKGSKLDARYTLLDKLGAGGQGEVWRAHDGTRGIDIALKVLNATADQDAAWSALEHEYTIASRLDHASIVKVFPPERSGDAMILPMELASGGDLRRLRGAGFLEIIPVLLEIAQALEHAHERGVVHRDLKPGNVLFDARGRARLADFGVAETSMTAEATASGSATAVTRDTNKHGFSPFTASPAQLRGEPPTPADDIYGLGALAYELLSGYPPYYPHFDRKRAIEERVPTLVPTRQIPPLLGALVMHMLAKDPKRRPRTMREVIDELDAALNDTLTFDFENVPPSVPIAPISTASSEAEPSQDSPQAGNGQASRATAPDAPAKQVVWTSESHDRRASPDRRGRRREDLTEPPQREPTISSDLSDIGAAGQVQPSDTDSVPAASETRSPRRSGAEALARIDAALGRVAPESVAQPKTTTPLTPAEAAAIVAAARAAGPKPTSQAKLQTTGRQALATPPTEQATATPKSGPSAGPASAPPTPSKSMWPREGNSTPASSPSPRQSGATTAAPTSSSAPAQTSSPESRSPGPSSAAPATSRSATSQPTPWHATPGQPTTTHWTTDQTSQWLRSQPTSSHAPAVEEHRSTARPTPGQASPAQPTGGQAHPTAGHAPSAQPTAGRAPAAHPTAGHASSAQPIAGRAPSLRPTAGQAPSAQPAAGHDASAQPMFEHGPSAHPAARHATSARPTFEHGSPAHPPAGHGTSAQPMFEHGPSAHPAAGHAPSAQPMFEHGSSAHPPAGHTTPGHAPFAAQPTPGNAGPSYPAGDHTVRSPWNHQPAPPPAQPAAAYAAGMAGYPPTVPIGTFGNQTSTHTGPMHATWGEIPLDGLPKVARLEPIRPHRWPWVFLGLLAGGAAAVYFWLPRFDPQRLPPEMAAVVAPLKAALTPNSSSTPTSTPAPVVPASGVTDSSAPQDTSAQSAIRSFPTAPPGTAAAPDAAVASPSTSTTASNAAPAASASDERRLREMRQTFDTRLAALEARGAGVWGGREFATAKIRAAESVGAHDAGNPRVAQERLAAAMKLLDTVEGKAPQALSAQVASGEKALVAGQQEVAGQAFDLARRINPTDRRASDGLRRTQNLNALLPLLADGQNAEAAHDYARAAQDYSQALSLDPGNATAKAGQARSNAAFGDDNYAKAVGSGFAALGAGRLDEAHDAFVKARALKPNGAEAFEGLRRVGAALTARGFASMRQRAAGLEAQERWEEAQRVYEDVLAADPSLAFAQEGKARTTSRADLSSRLQQLLDRSDRLASPGVREDARALLETAGAQSPQGPVIRSQIARLEILLPGFDKPVRLSLLSDNSTQVVISSIGSFGSFARRDIELRPGKYTVVGTRYGFRDVRREITVAPGQDTQTIKVTCSDPI